MEGVRGAGDLPGRPATAPYAPPVVTVTPAARALLEPGEVLVVDWHHVALCCAGAGEVSLHVVPRTRLPAGPVFRPASATAPVVVHRAAWPHLAGREVRIDGARRWGVRRFTWDLPTDFGLRAVLGRLPDPPPSAGGPPAVVVSPGDLL